MTDTPPAPAAAPRRIEKGSMEHLYLLIDKAGRAGVSDFHVVPGRGIYYKSKGHLRFDSDPNTVFAQDSITGWLDNAGKSGAKQVEPLGDRGHTSVSFDSGTYRVRASFRRTTDGVTVTFRLIPFKIPTADDLDLPQNIRDLVTRSAGLILLEGATGSGKTTTLAALKELVNDQDDKHVYTIEDPIEFVHKGRGNTLFTQREIGEHASDFPSGVENALRSNPDVIMVGELLNPATAKAALHAATTGHLVMTTAHAGSVTEALDSFIGQFAPDEQPQIRSRLSQSLLAVVCQRLVEKVGGGLVAAREVMVNDINFQDLISDGKASHMIHQSIESTPGCMSLEQSLALLVEAGTITEETALDAARKPDALRDLINAYAGRGGGRRR